MKYIPVPQHLAFPLHRFSNSTFEEEKLKLKVKVGRVGEHCLGLGARTQIRRQLYGHQATMWYLLIAYKRKFLKIERFKPVKVKS